jgi:hypothetical protein
LYTVGTKTLLVGKFSGSKAVHNFRQLVNPKTKVVSHDIPPGSTAPGPRLFTRIDGVAAWYKLSMSGDPPQPDAIYYAMKGGRVFQVIASGVGKPSGVATSAMRILLSKA